MHAFFRDEFRDMLYRMYNSKSRQELDARNSDQRSESFFEEVTSQYHKKDWLPTSYVFGKFHTEFRATFILSLLRTDNASEKKILEYLLRRQKKFLET